MKLIETDLRGHQAQAGWRSASQGVKAPTKPSAVLLQPFLSPIHYLKPPDIFESAQRQGTSNIVGNSARGYSGNVIPIMVSPDNGNATCNGTPPVVNVM